MCGIIVAIGNNSKQKAKECIQKLSHRGRDSCIIQTFNNISIGFNRLAINDKTDKGNQPFEFEEYIGVTNGEIYNYRYLKKKYHLTTISQTDTEVVLPLYSQYKDKILSLIDGFYSSVIYNKDKKEIVIIRDYLGKKPLFFAYDDKNQYITSELKALPKIDYFEMLPKGISKISINKVIPLYRHNSDRRIVPSKRQLKQLLKKAVAKRMIVEEDKKIGIFLSGGLDSSIIALLVSQLFPNSKMHYYSILDDNHPDYEYIKIIQKYLANGSSNFTMIDLPQKDIFLSIVKKVVYYTESYNPSIVSNGIGTFILSKAAKDDGIEIVLTGDGADEVFMGYYDQNTINIQRTWEKIQKKLFDDLSFTELRRIDLSSMANTIEIRCPFLDKELVDATKTLNFEDFFGNDKNRLNKNILREIFKDDLPTKIYNREKVPFDVGSGIQKLMIELSGEEKITESEYLKGIWNSFFNKTLSDVSSEKYFSSYPVFDDVIPCRGKKYKKMKIENLASRNNSNIWMFHRIRIPTYKISTIYKDRGMLHTIDELFCLIDDALENGMEIGSLTKAMSNKKIIHLTFDDGYKEHLFVAKELKKRYNLSKDCITFAINIRNSFYKDKLCMDVVYQFIEKNLLSKLIQILNINSNDIKLSEIKNILFSSTKYIKAINKFVDMDNYFLNKEEIISLSKMFSIASHCVNHCYLTSLNDDEIYKELNKSKDFLEVLIGKKITIICFPDGKHTTKINKIAKQVGYDFGLSINQNLQELQDFGIKRKIPRCK